jgi:hypothetical protein
LAVVNSGGQRLLAEFLAHLAFRDRKVQISRFRHSQEALHVQLPGCGGEQVSAAYDVCYLLEGIIHHHG